MRNRNPASPFPVRTREPMMVEHVSILWAGPENAEELAQIHAPLFSPAWDAPTLRSLLDHPGSIALLARTGQPLETAGFVLGRVAADEAEVLTLGVRLDRQRLGLGRRLLEAFCRAARKADARRLYLEVAADNAAAHGLYRRLGFEESGRRKGYYERPGAPAEDAINLSLAL